MKKVIGGFYMILCTWGIVLGIESCQNNPYVQGQALYANHCQSCHQANGERYELLMPPIAKSDYLVNYADKLPCIIKYGLEGTIVVNDTTYDGVMGALPQLSDVEITNIINYINNSFGNDNGYTSLEQVQQSLQQCTDR